MSGTHGVHIDFGQLPKSAKHQEGENMIARKLTCLVIALGLVTSLAGVAGSSVGRATQSSIAKGEPQPGDDKGGHGGDGYLGKIDVAPMIAKGEPQPGDDNGGHGGDGFSFLNS